MKVCSACKVNESWRRGRCKPCDYATSKAYEKTPKGYLVRSYRNITNRVKGIAKRSVHIYKGLPVCTKEEFYEWSLSGQSAYVLLLGEYKLSGYERSLSPSVDRIDSNLGYILGNMQWVTISKNVSLTAKTEEEIMKLPIGMQFKENRTEPYTVEKTFRGLSYYKTFSTLQEGVVYLESILDETIYEVPVLLRGLKNKSILKINKK
tara:strand:- start:67 stop:684 length:618 start_codon:yes stop_codon:yes gene_type:complete